METVTNLSPNHKVKPALCLDFDGTIRRSKSGATFIKNFQDIELMPGIEKIIHIYKRMGWLILGISNQAGVAHGFKLPLEIENEMDATLKLFKNNPFNIVKHCYFDGKGKVEPYCHRSLLRKPDTGMLALMEYEAYTHGYVVDWDNSIFVGDRPEDEQCAKNAGITFKHIDQFLNEPHSFTVGEEGFLVDTEKTIQEAPVKPIPTQVSEIENLDDMIAYYLPRFEGMEKTEEFKRGEEYFAAHCHSQLSGGIGMKMRNELGLWETTSRLHQYFQNMHKTEHPDDMSDLIIRGVYKKMKGGK